MKINTIIYITIIKLHFKISSAPDQKLLNAIPAILVSLGMIPITESSLKADLFNEEESTMSSYYNVMLDGRIIGHVQESMAKLLVDELRHYKIIGLVNIPIYIYI